MALRCFEMPVKKPLECCSRPVRGPLTFILGTARLCSAPRASELDALVGRELEEDQRLPHGPGLAVPGGTSNSLRKSAPLGLRDVQLRVQVVQQLLRPDLRVLGTETNSAGASGLLLSGRLAALEARK